MQKLFLILNIYLVKKGDKEKMNWRHVYKGVPWKNKIEAYRWHFWAWMMNKYPKFYKKVNKLFPNFTLPF